MIVLGINAYHADASACIVKDGQLIVAIEEERLCRVKHISGFPSLAIKECLKFANISHKEIDVIAISKKPSANLFSRLLGTAKRLKDPKFLIDRLNVVSKSVNLIGELSNSLNIDPLDIKAKIHYVEHHIAHISSGYFVDNENFVAGISIDGSGDYISTMIAKCYDGKIEKLLSVEFPHSLGYFYTALTQYLGFPNYGDEYKVMGLAAMGSPIYLNEMKKIIEIDDKKLFQLNLTYFTHHNKGVEMAWDSGIPSMSNIFSDELINLLGPSRNPNEEITQYHKDIAASVQAWYEYIYVHILKVAKKLVNSDNVQISGGCSQNSLANGRCPKIAGFNSAFIPSNGHDGGTSVGAALFAAKSLGEVLIKNPSPYLGRNIEEEEAKKYLNEHGISWQIVSDFELNENVINVVKNGGVVGWFQGRSEWGPRALGNRSILADPSNPNIKDILNIKIKRRESFRPFAPSIPIEFSADWFDLDSVTESIPYMDKVVPVKEDKKSLIPAVTHVDGTARAQFVTKDSNFKYWSLLNQLGEKTNIPILINTSFNENEPIVDSAIDAIKTFQRTKMDMLCVGNIIVSR